MNHDGVMKDLDAYDMDDGQQRGSASNTAGDLKFSSFYQKQFDMATNQMMGHSGNQKQLFTNLTLNLWLPLDMNSMTHQFNMIDVLEDEPEKMRRLQYFCEVPDYTTAETLLIKSIDNFNKMLKEEGNSIRLSQDLNFYCLRIAKKKTGMPNTDYPKVDLSQNVVDVDFIHFCLVYQANAMKSDLSLSMTTQDISNKKSQGNTNSRQSVLRTSGYEQASLMTSQKSPVMTEQNNQQALLQDRGIALQGTASSQQAACCQCLIF